VLFMRNIRYFVFSLTRCLPNLLLKNIVKLKRLFGVKKICEI